MKVSKQKPIKCSVCGQRVKIVEGLSDFIGDKHNPVCTVSYEGIERKETLKEVGKMIDYVFNKYICDHNYSEIWKRLRKMMEGK